MNLNEVHRGIQKNKPRKRIGRGPGSGHGKTSGRGEKGQKSRSGYSRNPIFQGGTMPLVRRVPKRGFNNRYALNIATVNIDQLDQVFENGEEVTLESLRAKSLAQHRHDELKILGRGELSKKLKVAAHRFSQGAREKIEKAGGEVVVVPGKTPVEEKKRQQLKDKPKSK